MKKSVGLLLALIATTTMSSLVHASLLGYRAMQGDYLIYGGSAVDRVAPTPKDRKIAFEVRGPVARDMFNAMGPDRTKQAPDTGTRERSRDGGRVFCKWNSSVGYACRFGFDLRSGKSIGGIDP